MKKKISENKKQVLEIRILTVELKNSIDGWKLQRPGTLLETEKETQRPK